MSNYANFPVVYLGLLAAFSDCEESEVPSSPTEHPPLFADVTAELGLDVTAEDLPPGTYFLPELMGGGLALFDYDNDADLDLLQVCFPSPGRPRDPAPNRLFRQQPDGMYVNVTQASGLGDPGYGQGVATGDVDNDGDLDVYVTNYGADAFYLNDGDGSFTEATAGVGFGGKAWSSSAAFLDYDADGALDLYVVHYLRYADTVCSDLSDAPEYCGPQHFSGAVDQLYRNRGDGVFADVTKPAGIDRAGKGLGVLCADLSGDGRVDIFVANDADLNQLWVNRGDGAFEDQGVARGVAVNAYGRPEASMGVTLGDANADGRFDLFMTHLRNETNTLYLGQEGGILADQTATAGFGTADLPYTGFGCGFFDVDNDGDLDLALVNGRIHRGPALAGADTGPFWAPYVEPNLLFLNDGRGRFSDVSGKAGTFAARAEVDRGLAFGDIDGDGAVDLAVGGLSGIRIFRNQAAQGQHWLRVRALVGTRDALGAVVRIRAGARAWVRPVLSGYSYLSCSALKVHFGLGPIDAIDAIEVRWPAPRRGERCWERFQVRGVDREVTLRQGTGKWL